MTTTTQPPTMQSVVKYWPLILYGIMLVASATAGQVQIAQNKDDIKDIKAQQQDIHTLQTQQAITQIKIQTIETNTEEIKKLIRELKD